MAHIEAGEELGSVMVLDILASLLEQLGDVSGSLTTFLGSYGYLAIFILMILEAAALPIPSEVRQ